MVLYTLPTIPWELFGRGNYVNHDPDTAPAGRH